MAEHAKGWPELDAFMARHQRVALMFSAGKDSAACLRLIEPWLDKVAVIWANPGRPYPEVVEYMNRVRAAVPHFVEARGNQPEWVMSNGWPTDVMPWEATPMGMACTRDPLAVPLVSAEHCRWANMWEPALHAVRASGASGVIKGEKYTDRPLPPMQKVFEGREYFRPLLDWTDAEVLKYLGDDLPPGYARGLTGSLDCMTCTAFLSRNPQRLVDLATVNPDAYREVLRPLHYMRRVTIRHMINIDAALEPWAEPTR
jgi:phosphoadenosine phosphosulfate reductase